MSAGLPSIHLDPRVGVVSARHDFYTLLHGDGGQATASTKTAECIPAVYSMIAEDVCAT